MSIFQSTRPAPAIRNETTVKPIEVMLLTVAQAARALQVSTRTVETLISSGQLASVTIGKSRRIANDVLRNFAHTGVTRVGIAA